MPSVKTANLNTRIDSSIKPQAESIPDSAAIDEFYSQISIRSGRPFPLTNTENKVPAYDEVSKSELNQMFSNGISQIKEGKTISMDDAFDEIEADWEK